MDNENLLTLRETPQVFEQLAATGASIGSLDLPRLRHYFAIVAPRAHAGDAEVTKLAVGAKLAVETRCIDGPRQQTEPFNQAGQAIACPAPLCFGLAR